MGVDADAEKQKEEGAGDQGIMFGYACRETEPLMPAPIYYAHRILHEMAKARHTGRAPELGPDAKSQVTLAYEDGKPVRADSIVVSTQHGEDVTQERNQGDRARLRRRGHAARLGQPRHQILRESRPAVSSSAAPTATPASPGARSSSTPMAALRRMAAAPSPARTRPRSTARRLTPPAISPRTSSRRGLPTAARCKSPMPSASQSRCRSMSICTAPANRRVRAREGTAARSWI